MSAYSVRIASIDIHGHDDSEQRIEVFLNGIAHVEVTSPQGSVQIKVPFGRPVQTLDQAVQFALKTTQSFGNGIVEAARVLAASGRCSP